MKNCLIILNKNAGGSKKISFDKVEKCLGEEYSFTRFTLPDDSEPDISGYDAVAICGGDGTLTNALQQVYDKPVEVFYFPSGTLNDKAKAMRRYSHTLSGCPSSTSPLNRQIVIGELSASAASIFSYVLAAGSFTPIGYTTKTESKKRLGALAYIGEVLKQYRIHRIDAAIAAGDENIEGEFTLIMYVKSPRCFGFRFNRAFDPESASGHLVAIRSPKHNGILGYIELFFPFFRVFFLGLKRERSGRIIFKKVFSSTLTLKNSTDFCRDGEKLSLDEGDYSIRFVRTKCGFNVIDHRHK